MCFPAVVDFLKDSTRLVMWFHVYRFRLPNNILQRFSALHKHFFYLEASLRLCGPSRCGSLQHRRSGSTTLVQLCSPRTATSCWSWSCPERRQILLVRSCLRRVTWRCFAEGRPAKASVGWTVSTLAPILPSRTLLWCPTSGVWSDGGCILNTMLWFSWFIVYFLFPAVTVITTDQSSSCLRTWGTLSHSRAPWCWSWPCAVWCAWATSVLLGCFRWVKLLVVDSGWAAGVSQQVWNSHSKAPLQVNDLS